MNVPSLIPNYAETIRLLEPPRILEWCLSACRRLTDIFTNGGDNMKLNSVRIVGYRSIQDLPTMPLGSPTVLAGHNDAGKSAIISAIFFLLTGTGFAESDRTYAICDEEVIPEEDEAAKRVEETYVAGSFSLSESEQKEFGSATVDIRRIARAGSKPLLEVQRLVPADSRLRDLNSRSVQELETLLKDLELDQSKSTKPKYIERLNTAIANAPLVKEWCNAGTALEKALPIGRHFDARSAVDAEVAIKDTLLTAYRSHLDSKTFSGRLQAIEKQLEDLLVVDAEGIRKYVADKVGDVGTISINPTVSLLSNNGLKSTGVTVTNQAGEMIHLQNSGAGRARRVALAAWEYNASLLAQSGQDVVLLYDEPDTHLDYGHQRELMALIHAQSKNPHVTVVVASHSMNLIDGTDISDVVHVKLDNHRTIIERLADDSHVGEHLGAIAASVGLRNTVLLHERLFVGVEGESEARALPVLFKLATGRYLESCGIAIWPCDNNEGARHFAGFLHKHGRNVAFLVDEDSTRNAKHVFAPSKLLAAGFDPNRHCLYLGDPNEIEELFTDDQWAAVANELWARDDKRLWSPTDFKDHRAGKFSKEILEMTRVDSSSGPSGKPAMLSALALSLTSAEEIPRDLREKFDALVNLAK